MLIPYFINIHFNVILPCTTRSSRWFKVHEFITVS
jgi:hypothetical protein